MAKKAYLLLGSNMGNRADKLVQALDLINLQAGDVKKVSALYETEAWGITNQDLFLNIAVELATDLLPQHLLECLLDIEKRLGRTREVPKYGPRVIDIDIILYEDEVVNTFELTVPHPAMAERKFTLTPLAEIASNVQHPVLGKTMLQLLEECADTLNVYPVGMLEWQPKNV